MEYDLNKYQQDSEINEENLKIIDEFAQILSSCKGEVIFTTIDGDRLVADSMLSALIGLAIIIKMAKDLDLKFECEFQEDQDKLNEFVQRHNLIN